MQVIGEKIRQGNTVEKMMITVSRESLLLCVEFLLTIMRDMRERIRENTNHTITSTVRKSSYLIGKG